MNDALTCQSLNSLKRSGWANDKCLKSYVLPPVAMIYTWFIATLAYRCSKGQFIHLCHLFCMQSNAIFHFYGSLYLLISGALIEFHRFDPSCCSFVTFTGCAAIWEALPPTGAFHNSSVWNTEFSKIMISYRLKHNIYLYFSSTGISRIPTTRWQQTFPVAKLNLLLVISILATDIFQLLNWLCYTIVTQY